MLRMLSRRDGAEPPADAEGLERFFSCVENNPEFARCISLAESRFLTKYATANKVWRGFRVYGRVIGWSRRCLSCVQSNPECAHCVPSAESRFLTKYASANKA